ncbi:MAG: bifunctional cobalt-precorrin-7 (C(5))-methyltransferase/cobalt-precorrin-6B (C(15))-methyltransferase [Thermodesulfovibrionales bacterium]
MRNKLYVIGIGYKPLDKMAGEIILNSSIILASNRLFEVFKGYDEFEAVKDRVKVINNVNETIEFISAAVRQCGSATGETPALPSFRAIVLLASGDPMFFGIGRRAVRELGKDAVEILPDLSSIQIAFSKIKESWDDAFLMSLHGGPDPEKRRRLPYEINDIPFLLQKHNKIAILTDKENSPSEIAKVLNLSPIARSLSPVLYVCERLGYADERVTEGKPEDIAGMRFSEPNVVIIQQSAVSSQPSAVTFGLKENEISHSRGLITKDEVRAVTIHKLRLPQKGVFWDIGAGSGSVSIEAARLYPELKIFTVEKDMEQIDHIKENKIRFNVANIEIVKGEAPDALNGLPLPDRVFIGGSGERLKEIMDCVIKKRVSLILVNAATIETMNDAVQCFENHGYSMAISEISVSRAKTIAGKRHMSALNPIFVITGEK